MTLRAAVDRGYLLRFDTVSGRQQIGAWTQPIMDRGFPLALLVELV